MPDRDGKGPRQRSPKPSKQMGGLKRGGCSSTQSKGKRRR